MSDGAPFVRRWFRLFAVCAVTVGAAGQMKAPPPNHTSPLPAPSGRRITQTVTSAPCPKPSAWSQIQIPEIRSAADLGWTFASGKGASADKGGSPTQDSLKMQDSLNKLGEQSKKAAGKYPDAAITRDLGHYQAGLQQMAACPGGGGAIGLAETPVLSIRHLTHTVNVIHQLHEEAKHPTFVPGRTNFRASELKAASVTPVTQSTSQASIPSIIRVVTGSTPQSKAGSELERFLSAGAKATTSNTNTTETTVVVTAKPAARVVPPATAQARNLANTGLVHPAAPGVVRSIKPLQPQNVNSMNNWIQRPARFDPAAPRETVGAIVETRGKPVFGEVDEGSEVSATTDLSRLSSAAALLESVDATGRPVLWQDVTRYTDFRDIRFVARPSCAFCDSMLGQQRP